MTQNELISNKKHNWDFEDILVTIQEKLKPHEYTFIYDLMRFSQNKTRFPLIHLNDVKIVNEVVGTHADVFHPFVGYRKITKDNEHFMKIMNILIKQEIIIDIDDSEILNIKRDSALMIFGFLYRKDYINSIEIFPNVLKVTLKNYIKNRLTLREINSKNFNY